MTLNTRTLLLLAFVALILTACGPCEEEDLLVIPGQLDPPNHSLVTDLRPELSWEYLAPCKPTEYIINLWTNATNGTTMDTGFGGPTGSSDYNWTPSVDLTSGVAYLWNVTAKNGTILSPTSPFWEFIVGPECEAVDLIAPDPLDPIGGKVNTLSPTYIWDYSDPNCTPEGYSLQVSTNSSFTALVVNMREANPIKAWTPSVTLSDCDRFYWRVLGINGPDDGPWSAVSNFRTDRWGTCPCLIAELDSVILLYPGAYEIVPSPIPELEWSFPGSCTVENFQVQISRMHDFGDEVRVGDRGSSTSWRLTDLMPHTQYWWKVVVEDDEGNQGEFSSPRSFFTGPECTPLVGLVAPELLSPIGGVEISENYARLRYTPGKGGCIPDGYYINLNTDAAFLLPNLLGDGEFFLPATTFITDPFLEDCTLYYWKVAQIQGGVRGPESDPEWFYTNISGTCPKPLPPPTPTLTPKIEFLQNAFCRKGPGTMFDTAAGYEAGVVAELIGQSVPGIPKWWRTDLRCWVSNSTGKTSGPVEELPFIKVDPPPTESPEAPPEAPACNEKIPTQRECEAVGGTWTLRPGLLSAQYYCVCD